MRIHIHHHYPCFEQQLELLIKKISKMGENLEAIKADLTATKEIVINVAADVNRLHDLINNMGEMPTPEEWEEVITLAAELKTSLQAVDNLTPE
jgi:ribosomal protein S15P/S13E